MRRGVIWWITAAAHVFRLAGDVPLMTIHVVPRVAAHVPVIGFHVTVQRDGSGNLSLRLSPRLSPLRRCL